MGWGRGKKVQSVCRTDIKLTLKMHSNIQQMQTNTVLFHLYKVPRIVPHIHRIRKYIGSARAQRLGRWEIGVGMGNGDLGFNGESFSLERWKIWEMDDGETCTTL